MEGTVIKGRYELLAVVGEGGEARVYRARDTEAGADVAVRVALHPRTKTDQEIPAAYHGGWVRLLDGGSDNKLGAYQVLEFLEGHTLAQVVAASPLTGNDWRAFIVESLESVTALHDAFWVHGDLNADNFFLTTSGWKLLELPFLRLDPPQGRTTAFGSIHTLAPEQLDGAQPDARSDLYSLGCVYYYAASGAWPHPGVSAQDVAIHALRFPAEPLAPKAPTLAPSWSEWVMTLLMRRPEERPAPTCVQLPF